MLHDVLELGHKKSSSLDPSCLKRPCWDATGHLMLVMEEAPDAGFDAALTDGLKLPRWMGVMSIDNHRAVEVW